MALGSSTGWWRNKLPQERVSVRKMRELLRLRYDLKLGQVQIARSCCLGQSTVFRYLKRFEESGLSWPLPDGCTDRVLEELLFSKPVAEEPGTLAPIDFAALNRQLQTHRHVSLQLLWEEYRAGQPEGYQYSYFCELYRKWKATQNVTLRQEHRAGEKMFVDWAGATVPLYDAGTGEVSGRASVFVATLGASSYTMPRCGRTCIVGSTAMCERSSSSLAARLSSFRTTRARQSIELAAMSRISTGRIWKWRSIMAWPCCRHDRASHGTRPRSRVRLASYNVGFWQRCGIGSSSRSGN